MDISTPLRRARRHYVAFPVFLLGILLTVAGGLQRADVLGEIGTPSPSTLSLSEDERMELPSCVHVQAVDGGVTLERATVGASVLQEGGILVSAEGVARLRAGAFDVVGLGGTFFLSVRGERVSLATIDVPVLVSQEDGAIVIPAGRQWEGADALPDADGVVGIWHDQASLLPVPETFKRDMLKRVSTDATCELPQALPEAQYRTLEAPSEEQVYGVIRASLEAGDTQGLHRFLTDPNASSLLSHSKQRADLLPALLLRSGAPKAASLDLLPFFVDDSALWLLAQLHHVLRETAWLLPPTLNVSEKELILRLFSFPVTDTQAIAASPGVLDRWETEGVQFLRHQSGAVLMVGNLLADGKPLLQRFVSEDYPDRLSRYVQAYLSISEPYAEQLPAQVQGLRLLFRSALTDPSVLRPLAPSSAPAAEAVTPEEGIEEVPPPSWTPQEVEQITYQALRDAGALFTVQTTISPANPHTAVVKSIVFAGKAGSALYDFTYDLATGEASEISKEGGEVFPYALSLSDLAAWAIGAN